MNNFPGWAVMWVHRQGCQQRRETSSLTSTNQIAVVTETVAVRTKGVLQNSMTPASRYWDQIQAVELGRKHLSPLSDLLGSSTYLGLSSSFCLLMF